MPRPDVRKVQFNGRQWTVTLPAHMVRMMGLEKRDGPELSLEQDRDTGECSIRIRKAGRRPGRRRPRNVYTRDPMRRPWQECTGSTGTPAT